MEIGRRLIGVQVHISGHKDTVGAFEGLCREAKWHTTFETFEMWYISPTTASKAIVEGVVGRHECKFTRASPIAWKIDVYAKTIQDIDCLSDLPLPAR